MAGFLSYFRNDIINLSVRRGKIKYPDFPLFVFPLSRNLTEMMLTSYRANGADTKANSGGRSLCPRLRFFFAHFAPQAAIRRGSDIGEYSVLAPLVAARSSSPLFEVIQNFWGYDPFLGVEAKSPQDYDVYVGISTKKIQGRQRSFRPSPVTLIVLGCEIRAEWTHRHVALTLALWLLTLPLHINSIAHFYILLFSCTAFVQIYFPSFFETK